MAKSILRFFGAEVSTGGVSDFIEDVLDNGAFVGGSKNKVALEAALGRIVLKGKFELENGIVTDGTITGFTAFVSGEKLMKGTGYDIEFGDFVTAFEDGEEVIRLLFTADRAFGSNRDDIIFAVSKVVKGGDGDDTIISNFRDKTIKGEDGNDLIFGGTGDDKLLGGNGRDVFAFLAPEDGVDRFLDFNVKKDKIGFQEGDDFAPLGATIEAAEFVIGAAAATADQHLIYDDASGALYWDADGLGGGAQVELARLEDGLKLTAASFVIEVFLG